MNFDHQAHGEIIYTGLAGFSRIGSRKKRANPFDGYSGATRNSVTQASYLDPKNRRNALLRALSVFFLLTGLRNPRCAKRFASSARRRRIAGFLYSYLLRVLNRLCVG